MAWASTSASWGRPGDTPDEALAAAVTAGDVRAAANRIAAQAVRTPLARSAFLEELTGAARALLKLESLQVGGAFKFRGAQNAVLSLTGDERDAGVVTYSSGNHARALATAAARVGVRAVIVMPSDAPRVKRAATEAALGRAGAGSRVVEYDPTEEAREETGQMLAEREGLTLIPPYDHPAVIAGQGTVGLELVEQVWADDPANGPLDEVYVCVGGGGLISGVAVAVKASWPGCRIIGVEPRAANDAKRSFETGVLHVARNPDTIADGTRTPFLGRYTFPLVRRWVDEMIDVTEDQIADAVRLCARESKLVVEPSGALGVAGLLRRRSVGLAGKRVGVVVSGGNVDFDRFAAICAGDESLDA